MAKRKPKERPLPPMWYVTYDCGPDRHGQFFWTEDEANLFAMEMGPASTVEYRTGEPGQQELL